MRVAVFSTALQDRHRQRKALLSVVSRVEATSLEVNVV
jgi:hypothetical protein